LPSGEICYPRLPWSFVLNFNVCRIFCMSANNCAYLRVFYQSNFKSENHTSFLNVPLQVNPLFANCSHSVPVGGVWKRLNDTTPVEELRRTAVLDHNRVQNVITARCFGDKAVDTEMGYCTDTIASDEANPALLALIRLYLYVPRDVCLSRSRRTDCKQRKLAVFCGRETCQARPRPVDATLKEVPISILPSIT